MKSYHSFNLKATNSNNNIPRVRFVDLDDVDKTLMINTNKFNHLTN
jgi:hypothetical protein